jgi:nickel-dependent lactate racemase
MITVPWGNDELSIPLPRGWRVLGTFSPVSFKPAADPETLCREALDRPISAQPLSNRRLQGKKVLIVTDDTSRPTPVARFFGPVRDALVKAGVQTEHIEVLFALGVHGPLTPAEAESKIGKENLTAHRWHNHNCFDPAQLVRLGTTSRGTPVILNRLLTQFDFIVLLGVIEPHLLLGYSGGLKMILPGCAGKKTIGRNHLQGMLANRFNYVGAKAENSPVRLDLEEGAGLLEKEIFLVNAILNHDAEIVRFFCGDPLKAFRAGADFVSRSSAVVVDEPADVVITNSRPFDADLRQGLKCLGNVLEAARPGGLILGFLYCRRGLGDLSTPFFTLPYPTLRKLLQAIGTKWLPGFSRWAVLHEPLEQQFLDQFAMRMLQRNDLWCFSENLERETFRKLGALRRFASVEAMITEAEKTAGKTATVSIFPYGGLTFASRHSSP